MARLELITIDSSKNSPKGPALVRLHLKLRIGLIVFTYI